VPVTGVAGLPVEIFSDGFEDTCDADIGEPDTEASAMFLGSIDNCDSSLLQVAGVLGTLIDIDYYSYSGSDTFPCSVDPTLSVIATDPTRACLYFSCNSGTAQLTCPTGSSAVTSTAGRPGCCTTDASLQIDEFSCAGTTADDAQVWLRFDTPAQTCTGYSATLSF
jgi:hypothetical protein